MQFQKLPFSSNGLIGLINWLGYFVPPSVMTTMMKEVMVVVTKEVMVVVIMQSKRLAATE